MSNPIRQAIESRVSTNYYDPSRQLSEDDIKMLADQATRAPSAYNLQNWKFIAVRSLEGKARLKAVSYGQQKVVDASVSFIICGTLAAHEHLHQVLVPSAKAGIMELSVVEGWVAQAARTYTDNPALQRDEAIRSASLAAMTLMLAAEGMGLATGAMIGFDPESLSREFNLTTTEVPAVIVTVGYPLSGNWPQKPRKPLHEVIEFV